MDKKQFSDEVDEMVERGFFFHEEFDINLKSFHLLKSVEQEFRFLKRFNTALIVIMLVLAAGLLFLLLTGRGGMKSATDVPQQVLSTAVVDTIEKLRHDNRMLKEKNASIEQQLKLVKDQLLSRDSETESRGNGVIFHEVKKGETLYTIAGKYYGDKRMYKKILDDNGLSGEADIYEGRRLKITLQK